MHPEVSKYKHIWLQEVANNLNFAVRGRFAAKFSFIRLILQIAEFASFTVKQFSGNDRKPQRKTVHFVFIRKQ